MPVSIPYTFGIFIYAKDKVVAECEDSRERIELARTGIRAFLI